jgi:hypothetical protein
VTMAREGEQRAPLEEAAETPTGNAVALRVVRGGRTLKLTSVIARAPRVLSSSTLDHPTPKEEEKS